MRDLVATLERRKQNVGYTRPDAPVSLYLLVPTLLRRDGTRFPVQSLYPSNAKPFLFCWMRDMVATLERRNQEMTLFF